MMQHLDHHIIAVRAFNRFHTRLIGVLDEGLLESPYSLAEARILYELAHDDALTASGIVRKLGLDPGYLSRLLKKLVTAGLVERTASAADRRRNVLALTDAGRSVFRGLEQDAQGDVRRLLAPLNPVDRTRLVAAMATIEAILAPDRQTQPPFVLRQHRPGDMGWVTHRHAVLYAEEYGWDERFEALVAGITAQFIEQFDPAKERCWIAEQDGETVGSAFLVRDTDETAKLRLLYVEPKARGSGLGRALVQECLRFARRCTYFRVNLWTNDILHAARRIYEKEGFRLVKEEAHRSFGHDLVGQYWEREL